MKITFEGVAPHGFRSQLERDVAAELDRHAVEWRYEVRVILPGGVQPMYLPDFTIDAAPDALRLPAWVECKPQQMLYDLRDTLGVTRRAGEYFEDDVTVEGVDAAAMRAYDIAELWKPKRLAELSGEDILVVGGVARTRTLTATMRPDGVVFSRSHPFANWPGHQKRIEQERQRRYWAEESQRQREQWEAQQQARELAAQAERRRSVAAIVAHFKPIEPRFASGCHGCGRHGSDGGVYRPTFNDGAERWVRICPSCEAAAT